MCHFSYVRTIRHSSHYNRGDIQKYESHKGDERENTGKRICLCYSESWCLNNTGLYIRPQKEEKERKECKMIFCEMGEMTKDKLFSND